MVKRAIYWVVDKNGAEYGTDCEIDTEHKEVFNFLGTISREDKADIVRAYVTIDGKDYPTYTIDGWLCKYIDD